MPSSNVALTPLHSDAVKKRPRRNFRPSKKATATTQPVKKRKQTGVAIGGSRGLLARSSGDTTTHKPTALTAVTTSAAATLNNTTTATANGNTTETTHETMDEMDAALLEQAATNRGDAPCLTKFCSRFKVKRKAKAKNNNPEPEQDAAPVAALVQDDPVLAPAAVNNHDTTTTNNNDTTNNTTNPTDTAAAATAGTPAGPVVQIIDGEIVLQESSMVVNGTTTQPDDEFSVVEEETQLAVVGASYHSFCHRTKATRWTVAETQQFYQALRQVGTDFGTMEVYFDRTRTRKQLKRKYRMECTKNPKLVEKALHPTARQEIDMSVFSLSQAETKKLMDEIIEKEKDDQNRLVQHETMLQEQQAEARQMLQDQLQEMQEEPIEEDWTRERAEMQEEPPHDYLDDPLMLMGTDETAAAAADTNDMNDPQASIMALVPGVVVKKTKKKSKFRSLRKKKKK